MLNQRHAVALAALLGTAAGIGAANAAPVPASAISGASAAFVISMTNGTVADLFVGPATDLPSTSGPLAAAVSFSPSLTTDCAVASTSCSFVGASGGLALAVDGVAEITTASGVFVAILAFSEPGSLTITSPGQGITEVQDPGAEPVGFAFADSFISALALEGIETFSLGAEETRTFELDAGAYALTWGGTVSVAIAARTLADVAEPGSLALLLAAGTAFAAARRGRRAVA